MTDQADIPEYQFVRVGRFAGRLPVGWRVKGASYHLENVGIMEYLWDQDDPEGLSAWGRRVAEISKTDPPPDVDGERIFARPKVSAPILHCLLHYDTYFREVAYLVALAKVDSVGVWLSLDGPSDNTDQMVSHTTWLARMYKVHSMVRDWQDGRVFFTQMGAFLLPPQTVEQAEVVYAAEDESVLFEFRTEVIARPDERSKVELFRSELSNWSGNEGSFEEIRGRERIVAGLKGEESVYLVRESDENEIWGTFVYPGHAYDAARPAIVVTLTMTADDAQKALATWDVILDSMHAL